MTLSPAEIRYHRGVFAEQGILPNRGAYGMFGGELQIAPAQRLKGLPARCQEGVPDVVRVGLGAPPAQSRVLDHEAHELLAGLPTSLCYLGSDSVDELERHGLEDRVLPLEERRGSLEPLHDEFNVFAHISGPS